MMNRQIQFRSWCLYSETMYDYFETHRDFNLNHCIDLHNLGHQNILMQFTGLKDKNGKEIYEGDILRTNYCQGEIVWWRNGWHIKAESDTRYSLITAVHSFEVIGNIYENNRIIK